MPFKIFVVGIGSLFIWACSPGKLKLDQVVDGDTLIVTDAEVMKLDLAYIDAPEREQPFGKEAKEFLKEKVLSDSVQFVVTGDEKLEIMFEGKSLNLIMVEQGYAWSSPTISDPQNALLYGEAQKVALEHLKGLWALGHGLRVAPWQWRQQGTEAVNHMANFDRQRAHQQAKAKQRQQYQRKLQQGMRAQRSAPAPKKDGQE